MLIAPALDQFGRVDDMQRIILEGHALFIAQERTRTDTQQDFVGILVFVL
jgi:hypothetical protein